MTIKFGMRGSGSGAGPGNPTFGSGLTLTYPKQMHQQKSAQNNALKRICQTKISKGSTQKTAKNQIWMDSTKGSTQKRAKNQH